MNGKIGLNDDKQIHKPYVEWDESVVLPSRKARYQKAEKQYKVFDSKKKMAIHPELQEEKISAKRLTGKQLRKHRIRYVRTMRFLRSLIRICLRIFLCIVILFVMFWWKFVYVYDFPPYIQKQFPQTTAFIAWKPWAFGPPALNLINYGNPANQIEMDRYLIRIDVYKDVVIHPIIIWTFKEY